MIDLGGIESARWLEALSLAWVVYSRRTGKTHHAFNSSDSDATRKIIN